MKIYRAILAAGFMMLVAAGCCQKCPKVTALVAGENSTPVAVVVEYAQAVKADAVNPGTFVLPGNEVAFAFVTDENPAVAKECKGEEKSECCKEGKPECKEGEEKPECCKGEGKCPPPPACCSKDGKFVVLVLKGAMPPMPPMAPGMGKPCPARDEAR
jgi:hypothetical protein